MQLKVDMYGVTGRSRRSKRTIEDDDEDEYGDEYGEEEVPRITGTKRTRALLE
jgi:hypothetical protein